MSMTKKLLSIALAVAMLVSAISCVAAVSASAEDAEGVAYSFDAYYRHYGWGEWPKEVHYTDNGYCELIDTGRFTRQVQLMYNVAGTAKEDSLKEACQLAYDDATTLSFDFQYITCEGSNYTEAQVNASEIAINIYYSYKDPDDPSSNDDPESPRYGYVSYETKYQAWQATSAIGGDPVTKQLAVDALVESMSDYEGFRIDRIRIAAMNYSNNAFREGDYSGQAGLGNLDIYFSPFYVTGYTVPEKGADLGLGFAYEERDGRLWFAEWEQGDQDTYGKDGPYGNGADIIRTTATEPELDILYGDVNHDESVDAKDVLRLRQHLADMNVDFDVLNSDCNGDGDINAKDLLILRQFLAAWDVVLGPQGD